MPGLPSLVVVRWVVALSLISTAAVFTASAADPVNVPKLACLLVLTLLAVAVAGGNLVRHRLLLLPTSPAALAGGLLSVALVVAAANAPQTTTAVLGAYGRNGGLLAYLAALSLFFLVLRCCDRPGTRVVAYGLLLAGLFTASYGLLQRLGIDSIAWNNPFNPIIASLGNPDFASAYLGISAPMAAWGALWTGWPWVLRGLSAALAGLCVVVAILSAAVQGPLAAAAGLGVVALALVLGQEARHRRAGVLVLSALAGVGLLTLLAGVLGHGPAHAIFARASFRARTWYWQAALTMWRRNPLIGIGLDSYGNYWRRDRPLAAPRSVGGEGYADSAHSVPLQHLAEGGLLLAAAYLVFVVVIAISLVRGLRRLAGQDRLLLAGLGGSWVAYQVQSLVSIDQVPLLLVNFVLGGAVVVAAGESRLREVRLPGALRVVAPTRGRRVPVATQRSMTGLDWGLFVVVGALTASGVWFALVPLRANMAEQDGNIAQLTGEAGAAGAAEAAYQRAIDLSPGIGVYRTKLGQLYSDAHQPALARELFHRAFLVDSAEVNAERAAANLAESAGDLQAASTQFDAALKADPTNSDTILEWARFQLRHGGAGVAAPRLERAVRDLPAVAGLWAELGEARSGVSDVAGAREAYQRALMLDPAEATAAAGLKKLGH